MAEAGHAVATSPDAGSRWAFLDAYIEDWFSSLMFAEAPTSTVADPRFDTFLVHLPSTLTDAPGRNMRRRLRYATELVAYMLFLDHETWWYARRRERPWFGTYDPSRYDPRSLIPKTTFAMSRVLQRTDDERGAVRLLHEMLFQEDDVEDEELTAFATAKRRIMEMDDNARRLRGFQIPTQLRLQPRLPESADELREYLRDVTVLVCAFVEKEPTATPFWLDAVALNVYATFLSDVHAELRALLSLGVPVTISLRHGITGGFIPDTVEWTTQERANVFSIFADDPSRLQDRRDDSEIFHTLDSKWIANSSELWSAVAFAPKLRKVRVQPTEVNNAQFDEQVARWMGFALARCPSLRSLEIVRFRMSEDELDALEAVLDNPIPASLVPTASHSGPLQWIRLHPDVVVACRPGGEINGYGEAREDNDQSEAKTPERLTLAQLNIPSDWLFPVVQTDAQTIEIIVPGHAVCSVPLSSVASWHNTPATTLSGCHLTSLVLHNEVYEEGLTARFVRLVGRDLRELRWYGEFMGSQGGLELQDDLDAIAVACPHLESLTVEETQLTSLASLVSLPLCELALLSTPVPMAALVSFFQVLQDKSAPIAHSLQRFTYHCPQQQLTIEGVDAALRMLDKNDRLYSVSLGIEDVIFATQKARFDEVSSVNVTVERVPLETKLGFLSVVQHQRHTDQSLGRLDTGCVATIFQCLGRVAERRLHLLQGDMQ